MKIYYFSGTGNSLYVAREIAKAFEGAELVPILSALKDGKTEFDADWAVFVFPIHINAMPTK
jgi:flavodoxin